MFVCASDATLHDLFLPCFTYSCCLLCSVFYVQKEVPFSAKKKNLSDWLLYRHDWPLSSSKEFLFAHLNRKEHPIEELRVRAQLELESKRRVKCRQSQISEGATVQPVASGARKNLYSIDILQVFNICTCMRLLIDAEHTASAYRDETGLADSTSDSEEKDEYRGENVLGILY